jgi:hypothetical protein
LGPAPAAVTGQRLRPGRRHPCRGLSHPPSGPPWVSLRWAAVEGPTSVTTTAAPPSFSSGSPGSNRCAPCAVTQAARCAGALAPTAELKQHPHRRTGPNAGAGASSPTCPGTHPEERVGRADDLRARAEPRRSPAPAVLPRDCGSLRPWAPGLVGPPPLAAAGRRSCGSLPPTPVPCHDRSFQGRCPTASVPEGHLQWACFTGPDSYLRIQGTNVCVSHLSMSSRSRRSDPGMQRTTRASSSSKMIPGQGSPRAE